MKVTVDLDVLARFLGYALGAHTEVAIHDLSNLKHSLKIIHNPISRREIGAGATDFALKMLHECSKSDHAPFQTNYRSKTVDGRELRSSSMVVKDASGQAVAMICLNSDDNPLLQAIEVLKRQIPDSVDAQPEELLASSIETVGEDIMQRVLGHYVIPSANLTAEEKRHVVQTLEQSGVFLVKGFVARAAHLLNISEQTLYRYLKT